MVCLVFFGLYCHVPHFSNFLYLSISLSLSLSLAHFPHLNPHFYAGHFLLQTKCQKKMSMVRNKHWTPNDFHNKHAKSYKHVLPRISFCHMQMHMLPKLQFQSEKSGRSDDKPLDLGDLDWDMSDSVDWRTAIAIYRYLSLISSRFACRRTCETARHPAPFSAFGLPSWAGALPRWAMAGDAFITDKGTYFRRR